MVKKALKKLAKRARFETAGYITVDAGLVQVGDPCYGNVGEFKNHDTWMKYLTDNEIFDMDGAKEIPHRAGQDWARTNGINKAIVVSSGFGDGVYPVEIKRDLETGAVKELRVKFF